VFIHQKYIILHHSVTTDYEFRNW